MKIALVGSSGYVSEFILKRLSIEPEIEDVLKIDCTGNADAYIDLSASKLFDYNLLNDVDYVVFTAAVSSPDMCAREFEKCWRINVIGTCYFIQEAINRNCRVLFFSSDAAFGNRLGKIYNEDSLTEACTPYGKMKKTVEDTFKDSSLFKAIRLSYVASAKDRFIQYCLNCVKNHETADIFHPFYRNVVVVSDVVDIVIYFIFHWNEFAPSFLNVAGKELVSRVRIADELNRFLGGKLKYTISIPKEGFFENRPMITQMESLYMQKYKILQECTFSEKIAKELKEIEL